MQNLTNATQLVHDLANHFSIHPPTVELNRGHRSWYFVNAQRITLSPWGTTDSVLHEFAHHYNHVCFGAYHHKQNFWVCLHKITTFYYYDPRLYHWEREYKIGIRYALQHGLLSKSIPSSQAKTT